MARKYVLGPNAARKVAALLRGSGEVSRRQGAAPGLAFDSEYVAPFTVQYAASLEGWIVWLPDEKLVTAGETALDVASALSAAEGYPSGWYSLDVLGETGGELVLEVVRNAEGGLSAEFKAAPAEGGEEPEGDEAGVVCRATVAVAERSSETGAVRVRQCVDSAIVFPDVAPDGDSVDAGGGESRSRLQLAHFNDDERDSGRGLSERLSVAADGKIVADDDGLMLVARKDGKVMYVPLSGAGEDPDLSGEGETPDPCDHPGDRGREGGVAADADDAHSSGGVEGGVDGGVAAGGRVHPGDDNCNCD